MATNNLSSDTSSLKTATSVLDQKSNIEKTLSAYGAIEPKETFSGTVKTDTADSIGVNLSDEQRQQVYGTENGKTGADRYTGSNTQSRADQLVQDYDASLRDYTEAVDQITADGEKAINKINDAGQAEYQRQEAVNAAAYQDSVSTREAIEANNGNRDGIGHSQFGSLEQAYSARLGELWEAENALINSTSRDIADLRAKGEYEKANAKYAATVSKLQAMYEEEMRIDTNLRKNYEYMTDQDMDDKEIAAEEDLENMKYQRELGMQLIAMGIMPNEDVLNMIGIDRDTALKYMYMAKFYGAGGGGGGYGSGGGSGSGSGSGSGGSTNPYDSYFQEPETAKSAGYTYSNYGYGSVTDIKNEVYKKIAAGDKTGAYQYVAAAVNGNALDAGMADAFRTTIDKSSSSGYSSYKSSTSSSSSVPKSVTASPSQSTKTYSGGTTTYKASSSKTATGNFTKPTSTSTSKTTSSSKTSSSSSKKISGQQKN